MVPKGVGAAPEVATADFFKATTLDSSLSMPLMSFEVASCGS